MTSLRRFADCGSGNIAVTFALVISVLLLVVGTAIDYSRAVWASRVAQMATDDAVLVVSTKAPDSLLSDRELAQQSLDTNSQFPLTIDSLETSSATSSVRKIRLTTSYSLPTTLMKIFSVNYMDVSAASEVTRSIRKLEVALVLDNTGSMTTDNRIGNLKTAALSAVNIITTNNPLAKIGLVPFAASVNIGTQYQSASWIDGAVPFQHLVAEKRASTNQLSSVNRFDLFAALGIPWAGCVEARYGDYDMTDDPPMSAATAFIPAFDPDDYGDPLGPVVANQIQYVNDDGDCAVKVSAFPAGDAARQQNRTCKYFLNTVVRRLAFPGDGPNNICTTKPLTRLTSSVSTLTTAINAMVPSGSTDINQGVGWGFRVLSNKAPFADGMTNSEFANGGSRVMILLTDGDNTLSTANAQNGSMYTVYGYKNDTVVRLPGYQTATYADALATLNAKTLTTCTNAKNAGIEIFTIGVSVTSQASVDMLTACASDPSKAKFISDSSALIPLFQGIAAEITPPFLSQ